MTRHGKMVPQEALRNKNKKNYFDEGLRISMSHTMRMMGQNAHKTYEMGTHRNFAPAVIHTQFAIVEQSSQSRKIVGFGARIGEKSFPLVIFFFIHFRKRTFPSDSARYLAWRKTHNDVRLSRQPMIFSVPREILRTRELKNTRKIAREFVHGKCTSTRAM